MRMELRPTWTLECVHYWRTPFSTMKLLEKTMKICSLYLLLQHGTEVSHHFGDPPGSNAKIIGNGSLSHSLQGGLFFVSPGFLLQFFQ